MQPFQVVLAVVEQKLRPRIPNNANPQWRDLIVACWSEDPAARPSFDEIMKTLENM
jgi:hypothetical protein